jgi:FAD/FMN-containing dehydrogenase
MSTGNGDGVEELRAELEGAVVAPGEQDWDAARGAWNLAVDQHPDLVVQAAGVDDVVATVGFARRQGLRVNVQGTGHGSSPIGALDGTILLRPLGLDGVELDGDSAAVRAEAGVLWGAVTGPAAERGLAALAGSSPGVAVTGYTLGGGIGFLARTHGFACNSVTAIEAVTAEGEAIRIDAENEPDLFWALRGGGGSFAVVTALEFDLHPTPELYAGMLAWPWERASEVLQAWRESLPGLPDAMASLGRLMRFPPLPEIPDFLRGRSLVIVEAVHLGPEAEGAELLAPLRELGPEIDTVTAAPLGVLGRLHMDPQEPVPGIGDHMLLSELGEEPIEAIVGAAGPGSGSPLISVEVRHLGGALRTAPAGGGALSTIEDEFATFGVGIAADQRLAEATRAALERLRSALSPWDTGRTYLNFTDRPVDPATLFEPGVYARLREVKAAYDPGNLMRANFQIPPADGSGA